MGSSRMRGRAPPRGIPGSFHADHVTQKRAITGCVWKGHGIAADGKVHMPSAPAFAAPRLLDGDTAATRRRVPVKTACKKLSPFSSSMYLQH